MTRDELQLAKDKVISDWRDSDETLTELADAILALAGTAATGAVDAVETIAEADAALRELFGVKEP